MMAFTSTVSAALTTVYGYLETVAANANLSDPVEAFYGWPITTPPANWCMVGDFSAQGNRPVTNYVTDYTVLLPRGNYVKETYQINVSLVVWGGASDITAGEQRLSDIFSLYNTFCQQVADDPNGGGALGGSGSWGKVQSELPGFGPFETEEGGVAGWGIVMEVGLTPVNVQVPIS